MFIAVSQLVFGHLQKKYNNDVNNDGKFTIADIVAVIQILNEGVIDGNSLNLADVNNDGQITIEDVNLLTNLLLSEEPSGKTIDAIYITSKNEGNSSLCYLLKDRPVIINKKDKIIIRSSNSNELEIPLTDNIKVELGCMDENSIGKISNDTKKKVESKVYFEKNKVIIYHKGVKYNINGTLYK